MSIETEGFTEEEQISVLARYQATEEADIDFLLVQLGMNLDDEAPRPAIRSFRRQMILAGADRT